MKRLAVMGLVLLAGCRATTAGPLPTSTTVTPVPATTTTTAVSGLTRAEIEATLAEIGPVGSIEQARAVLAAVASGTDPDLVPYLYDIARVSNRDMFQEAMVAVERLTGATAPSEDLRIRSLFYGNWIMDNAPDPGPGYVAWKAALLGNIDPAFTPLLQSLPDAVTATRLQWGGVRRGGIPELNDAPTVTAADAGYMTDKELVFGAVVNGEARAYPVRILGHHELANDTLGGEPVSLVYCTLCRTPVFYSREVDGMVLDFETSGLLANSNKVMVDVQTDSLWNQLTGEAFAGPLAGKVLEALPMVVTGWAAWVAEHPETDVQAIPADGPSGYSYEPGDAYADYYAGSELWFPTFTVPDVFAEKDEVVTLDYLGSRLAVLVDPLVEAGGLVTTVAGRPVVFVATGTGARVFESADGVAVADGGVVFNGAAVEMREDALVLPDGTELPRLVSGQSFWFAWYGNYPDTTWWPAN